MAPILPGATLGVLGGGQLGRMFSLAARSMGYRVSVFAPEDDTPAGQIAYREVRAPYDDLDAVREFASDVSVVTFEFENVPAATAAAAAERAPVRPAGALLHSTQQRQREKEAIRSAGVPVANFAVVASQSELDDALKHVGAPAILKTAAWGYDGKGQVRVDRAEDAADAWESLGRSLCVWETVVPFQKEISVIGVRGLDGDIALYDAIENDHANHILDVSTCPADISKQTANDAREITRTLLAAWDVVGLICVEMFVLPDGGLVVNEIAPRPHNSGHLTIDAHSCSQFEQQVRSICGLPLGSTESTRPSAMANLLGDLWTNGEPDWAAALAYPGVSLHLYGKGEARPGRKMGHLTALAETRERARDLALNARSALVSRVHR